jgi:hypothetical protein
METIADSILSAISKVEPSSSIADHLRGILKYIEDIQEERRRGKGLKPEASALREAIKADFTQICREILDSQDCILENGHAILMETRKTRSTAEEAKTATSNLEGKVGKMTDAADKIENCTKSYRDAVMTKPTATTNVDPKVLGDRERKAKQILVQIFENDEEGKATLAKSLTEIKEKANEVIASMEGRDRPKGAKVESAIKTRGKAVVLTLNSRETVEWLRDPGNEVTFTRGFSDGSHIKERLYNLILPRVPISFNPDDEVQLRELEEVNDLPNDTVAKAKWIKPIDRRRPDQTVAYAVLSLRSVEHANILIRDGILICGVKIRPAKQTQEPIQCMKCRGWGHFATDCMAEKDTCGNCGEAHRTSACKSKEKVFCVLCKEHTHASRDRNCPEAIRRRETFNERNPENAMPYFPTEQEWTLAVRPSRITLDDRFPQRFAVNSLPTATRGKTTAGNHPTRRRQGDPTRSATRENPNFIPIPQSRTREQGELLKEGNTDLTQEVDDLDADFLSAIETSLIDL